MNIKWNQNYELGIKKIDSQHRRIAGLINRLCRARKENQQTRLIQEIIHKLIYCAHYHFTFEKMIISKCNSPELEALKASHAEFINKLKTCHEDITSPNPNAQEEVIIYLTNWLLMHILVDNRKNASLLKQALAEYCPAIDGGYHNTASTA